MIDFKKALDDLVSNLLDECPDESPGYPGDEAYEWVRNNVYRKAMKGLCDAVGHRVVSDACGRAEHDYCWVCEERRPGEAPHRKKTHAPVAESQAPAGNAGDVGVTSLPGAPLTPEVAAERERCAKIAESFYNPEMTVRWASLTIADKIRSGQ